MTRNAFWISPKGQMFPIEGGSHITTVIQNPDKFGYARQTIEEIDRKHNERLGLEGNARKEIILTLISQGWIRARKYGDKYWSVNILKLNNKTKDLLYGWAKKVVDGELPIGGELDKYLPVRISALRGGTWSRPIGEIAQDGLYDEGKAQSRIRNHLVAQYFPEFDTYSAYSEWPAIVKWCLDPKEIADLSFEEFARMVNGRHISRLREIYDKAASSIGCEAHPSVAFEARTLLETVQRFDEIIRETDKKIADVCNRFKEYRYLCSIPGFGPDISAKVLGAIGNPHRFQNHRQVLKTAGLDLSADRSGKRSDTIPVISKRGKADLRYGLYQAALIAPQRNPSFMRWFSRVLEDRQKEKGIRIKMRIKLAAKMLVIAWTLMKKQEVFDPGYVK